MSTGNQEDALALKQYRHHPRRWQSNFYVYPVISRRSGGLSIGINLNPDTACNFDCIYCQVDRSTTPRVREVVLSVLEEELRAMLADAQSGALFAEEPFRNVPAELRTLQDIAFSGDGEPTTCPEFLDCVRLVARLKREAGLTQTKIVLITDACYLTRSNVVEGLAVLDANQGEIWAKLDAGTEEYYRKVNRPNYPLSHVLANIIAAARVRPIVVQAMFMRIEGMGPGQDEVRAFADRLNEITAAGGMIKLVQVYTVARRPAVSVVTELSREEVDAIARRVREQTGLETKCFYGSG